MDPIDTEVRTIPATQLEPGHRLLGSASLPRDFRPLDVDMVVVQVPEILAVLGGDRIATVRFDELVEIENEEI
jgi:hypothetical protein